MPAHYRVFAEHRLVITEVWGDCSDADIDNVYAGLPRDPDFDRAFDQILDLRRVRTFSADGARVRAAGAGVYEPGVRRAVLAGPGFVYGMARMFGAGAEGHGYVVEIFSTPSEAERWLGLLPGVSGLAEFTDV